MAPHLATPLGLTHMASFDALPEHPLPTACPSPMLATLGTMPSPHDQFGYEVKWDGYRALARWDGQRLTLCSRSGIDLVRRFPEVTPLGKALRHPAVLDGELVALDRDGHPDFSALQTRMPRPAAIRSERIWDPAIHTLHYMIFDVLYYDRKATMRLPYTDRRGLLESLALSGPAWQTPPMHPDGVSLLTLMRQTNQEGIIAKRYRSAYRPGHRSPDWIKIKVTQSDDFVVVGWWSSGKNGMSSLLLGYYPNQTSAQANAPLIYCGKVGAGFSDNERNRLERALKKIAIATPQVTGSLPRAAGVHWCRPAFVAQVRYSEWTHDGALRHPTFLGLRSDKMPHEVIHHPQGR